MRALITQVLMPVGQCFGPLAQLVEHRTFNPLVLRSSRRRPTIYNEWRGKRGKCCALAFSPTNKKTPLFAQRGFLFRRVV